MSTIVVCALARHENLYINDWLRWWRGLGIDHFYIYDNNDVEDGPLDNVIDPSLYPDVTVVNIRGRHGPNMQHRVYEEFYRQYGKSFDWCFFVDVDEFLNGVTEVHEWLGNPRFGRFQAVRIQWKLFGDDDLIERDMRLPVWEAFTQESRNNATLMQTGKSVVRGRLPRFSCRSCHWMQSCGVMLWACLPTGELCKNKHIITDRYTSEIKLNHYRTKSLSEFMQQKFGRGDAMFSQRSIDLSYYFEQNTKTDAKVAWLKEHYGIEL